jgi:hypothetical protein
MEALSKEKGGKKEGGREGKKLRKGKRKAI